MRNVRGDLSHILNSSEKEGPIRKINSLWSTPLTVRHPLHEVGWVVRQRQHDQH